MNCDKLLDNVSTEYKKQQSIIHDLLSGKIDGKDASIMLFESLDRVDSLIDNYKK